MKTIILSPGFNLITDVWFIALLVIVIVLAVVVVILYAKISKLSDEVEKNTGFRKNGSVKHFTTQADVASNNNILNRLQRLENKSNIKQESRNEATPPLAISPSTIIEEVKSQEIDLSLPEKPKVIEFYMSTPNPDGSFEVSQSSDVFRQTISLYKFIFNPNNPLTASFEFYSDDSGTKDALTNPKRYLEPVCYEENDAFIGAKKIVVTKAGTAYKNGDKWIIDRDKKLRIKYQ
jgi:hypothetical protein